MKISLHWLKDYVPFNLPAEKLAHRLTMAGLEVEKIEHLDGDTVIEMEITPNRPDCLNVLGVARETAATLNKALKLPRTKKIKYPTARCPIEILDRQGCPRYIGTVIRDVVVKDSPDRMAKRLKAIGARPINNIVDITNFCLQESGQPMHAFDYDKLIGGKVVVRRARAGEKITTLDGVTRPLDPSILVIADARRPVAIAGIMGGQETEVTAHTKNILLESAYFDPVLIRRGGRALGVATDSSYRFERGVNILGVEDVAHRAVSLILQMAGGSIVARNDLFPEKRKVTRKRISITMPQIERLLGDGLTPSRCKTILKKLGFQVTLDSRKVLHVTPPSFRGDIKREEDIIEELARIVGYDALPSTLPVVRASTIPPEYRRIVKAIVRTVLQAQGFDEAVLYSLTNQAALDKALCGSLSGVAIKNPLTQDQEMLRPAVLPNWMPVIGSNVNRGQKDLRLFEVGKIYPKAGEQEVVSLVMTGLRQQDWRTGPKARVDFFDLKGAVTALLGRLGAPGVLIAAQANDLFAPGQGAVLRAGKKDIGIMGILNQDILRNWDIKQDNIYFAQIDLEFICQHPKAKQSFHPPSGYPAVTRDVSLAVDKTVLFRQVEDIALKLGEGLLKQVNFVEEYLGEKIPPGQRGLVFSLVYQSSARTLTEEEVNAVHQNICREFTETLGATIR